MPKFIITILLLSFDLAVFSQQVNVRGTLISIEDRKPLNNYLLIINGTDSGTTTGSNGNFELILDTLRTIEIRNPAPYGTGQFIKIAADQSGEIELGQLHLWSHGLGLHYFSKRKEKMLFDINSESSNCILKKENGNYIFESR